MSGVSNTAMDDDLEDGEISSGSNSDSEMGTTSAADAAAAAAAAAASSQAPGVGSGSFSAPAFQSRAAVTATATAASVQRFSATTYRSTATSSDSDSDDADEEEAAAWRRNKRQKVNNNRQQPPTQPPSNLQQQRAAAAAPSGGRKVNNIWGSVVQEQSQESVAAELGVFGMEGGVSMASRNVETYNYVLARKMMEKEREEEKMNQGGEAAMMLDAELDAYMKGKNSSTSDAKRKRPPVKDRLGPRAEMDLKGRYEITENDPEHSVVDEIAYRLQEPKKDLIERVVRVIGRKKAIELLGQTATLEENGGVYTIDGSRRRTPGGVYLNLLKNTPSITASQVRKVFQEETEEKARSKKAAQKRRRHLVAKKMKQAIHTLNLKEQDDGSRETFHGDTSQALEDVAEEEEENEEEENEEEEEDRQPEPAVGIEETPVVYNGTDLEVF